MSFTCGKVRLRFRASINPSRTEVAGLSQDTEVSFVPMEAVGTDGTVRLDTTRPLLELSQGYSFFRDGDVLVPKITPCFENGKGAVAAGLKNGIGFGTTELHVLRPTALDPRYLFYTTLSHDFRVGGAAQMYGSAGQKRVPESFVRDFLIVDALPDQQTATADFLDAKTAAIDALIAKKERLIELLHEKRRALIAQAVTKGLDPNAPMKESGVEWLGAVPSRWTLTRLGHIARVVRGASPRPAGDPRYFNGEHKPWITVGEITRDEDIFLRETQENLTEAGCQLSRVVPAGTLLLTNSGATLGVPKVTLIEGCINDGSVAFLDLSPSAYREYLYYYLASLTSNYRERLRQGAGQPNLNTELVRGTPFPRPPLPEQEALVGFLNAACGRLRALGALIGRQIDRLREYRQALISAAVTGQIDVRAERGEVSV